MIKKFEVKSNILEEDLEVTRIKHKNYYEIILDLKESKIILTKNYADFDELLEDFIDSMIKNAYFESKIADLEKSNKGVK